MEQLLIDRLLSRIPFFSYPNNPRRVKVEKKPVKYLFTSTQFVEKKDEDGVVHVLIKGTTCKRNPPKPLSKRDLHRQSVEN